MKWTAVLAWSALIGTAVLCAAVGGQFQAGGQSAPKTRPVRHQGALSSDFPRTEPSSPATAPSTQAAENPQAFPQFVPARDEDLAIAVDKGIAFLLSQIHDGDITTAKELSEPQRQSLFALVAYALAQTGQSVDDPRISIKGKTLPAMLDKLKTFLMVSDVEKMNRPVTYGRSLRAAALATYDRPQDRAMLKADVAWLVAAQIEGAYTYDDFYNELVKKGMNGSSRRNDDDGPGGKKWALGSLGDLLNVAMGGLLIADNPYPPPPGGSATPPPGNSVSPPPGIGGTGPGKNGNFNYGAPDPLQPRNPNYNKALYPNYIMPDWINGSPSRPYVPNWPRPTVPWWHSFRSLPPSANYIGPRVPNRPPGSSGGHGIGAPASVRPYGDTNTPSPQLEFQFPWDNSNSQYGVFGVWAGAEVGVEVPDAYWQAVQHHWISCQLPGGQWSYAKGDPQGTLAMTAGGVASLLITHEYLDLPLLKGQIGREPYSPNLASGLAWMEKANNGVDIPSKFTHYMGYELFGVSRVGLNTGYKFLGTHDWYRELSTVVVHAQFPNGAWGHDDHGVDAIIDTAYSLLFLARGRPPVMMTKLKFDKYWDNRPRDVSNLSRFAGKQLERQINWQVVGIEHTWDEWFDSPVLYIASHAPPKLRDRDYNELGKFAWAGGLIFTHADASSANFDQWVTNELVHRIAPGRQLVPIPDSDPIYSVLYKLPIHRRLMGVSNGARWLLVHSPNDIALAWQMRSDKTRLPDLQLGVNIFLYAAGKVDLRNRLESPFVAPPQQPPTRTLRVARLSFNGNWDPEPAAWPRFSRILHWETGTALDITPLPIEKLDFKSAPLATLTGTGSQDFTKAQCDALTNYVKSGGILIIDPCAGDNNFRLSLRESLLPNAFGNANKTLLPPELTLPMKLRPYSIERHGASQPQLELLSLGKGHVLFSSIDLTSGLLGTNTYPIDGYQPASAEAFLQHVVAWATK